MVVKFPCDTWVHPQGSKINKQMYKRLQNEKSTKSFYIIFTTEFLLFSNLNNEEFIHIVKGKKNKCTHVDEKNLPA